MNRIDISQLKKNRSIYLKIGFISALSFVIFAFNYTMYEDINPIKHEVLNPDIIDVEIIRTKHKTKPLPPPPKLDLSEPILEDNSPEFIEEPIPESIPAEVTAEPTIEPILSKPRPSAPKPIPKPTVIPKDEVEVPPFYTIVENMPEFGDCGETSNKAERKQQSTKNLLQFIYKHIKYPRQALVNGIEGRVFVRFIVNKDGDVQDIEIIREPGGGLGKEVLRVVKLMPTWKPGRQGRHYVNVQYTLPVDLKPM